MNLLQFVQDKFRNALTGYVDNVEDAVALVKPAQDPKFGDYQANCAMSLAKELKKKPRQIAEEIVARLDLGKELQPPDIAGPGFINIRFQPDWLAEQIQNVAGDERLGIELGESPRTIVIDYSSPNIAKPLHVGHLRSTIIGDALTRLLRFLGHTVITDNHLGDWGTQFGMILYGYKNFLDQEAYEADPVHELARLYKHVRDMIKLEESRGEPSPTAEAARLETAKLHAGDEENVRLWNQFIPHCMEELEEIYRRLDVSFDHYLGESFYNPMLQCVVDELVKEGVAKESEGAIAIFFGEDDPPSLVQKKDGAFTYTTSDIATIQYRMEQWNPDEILYVVDFRQTLHFQNLFKAAKKFGYENVKLLHVSFGSLLGEDGKPLSTREGAASLNKLLDDAIAEASRVYDELRKERLERGDDIPELSPEERKELDEMVGIGAVKYADFCQNRTTDYKFILSKMCAMAGNTATYMQYAYVRTRGILRKGEEDPQRFFENPSKPILGTSYERQLGLMLLRFSEALNSAEADYQPSAITSYLWELSQAFSAFFVNCKVLKAETDELRESRLILCELTGRVIKQGLALLGIKTPERM